MAAAFFREADGKSREECLICSNSRAFVCKYEGCILIDKLTLVLRTFIFFNKNRIYTSVGLDKFKQQCSIASLHCQNMCGILICDSYVSVLLLFSIMKE